MGCNAVRGPAQVTVVHGYFLHDSGSGTYVRELTRELVREGHDVTLVCQERSPELYDFIDSVYVLDEVNATAASPGDARRPRYPGRCRLVRPNLGGRLLVYVEGPFPGFARDGVKAFQDAPTDWIEGYVAANLEALRTTFATWPPDVVLANHAMMQPHVVKHALADTAPASTALADTARGAAAPYVVTVHGSELNFSVKHDPRLVPYTTDGLDDAVAIVTNSGTSAEDVVLWARAHGLDIAQKTRVVPPGINAETFAPAASRVAAIDAVHREVALPAGFELRPDDDVLAFAGRLMWTKGIQHAVAALALIAQRRPGVRLLAAGDGPARAPLERLAAHLSGGDAAGARRLALAEQELQTLPEFGPVVPEPDVPEPGGHTGELHVAFLGHLTPAQLARVFAAADVSLAPSIFPESLGLVTMEAMSAGALPIASYHSGLMSVLDVVAESLADPAFRALAPGGSLTAGIARLVVDVLERYPTADPAFRSRLRDLSAQHFPTWEKVARRYLELAAGARRGRP